MTVQSGRLVEQLLSRSISQRPAGPGGALSASRRMEHLLVEVETADRIGLGASAGMYRRDPGLSLKAIGFFKDGDLASLSRADQDLLRAARDRVSDVPDVRLLNGLIPGEPAPKKG